MPRGRQLWVVVHRWAGLTIALFLMVAGTTGIFLAWLDELDAALAPGLHVAAPPSPRAQPLDPLVVRQEVLARYPGGNIDRLPLTIEPGRSIRLEVERRDSTTGATRPWSENWDELFVDPYTGKELGRRKWGDLSEGPVNLMPFLYRLHYSFALGDWGILAFGIAVLIWTLDCFVGFYLTLPIRIRRKVEGTSAAPGWLQRWKPSWLVRWGASAYKINFDLHRAGGLWIWPMLLVFAWSSVGFNLPQVYNPVMQQFGYERIDHGVPSLEKPRLGPRIDFDAAARLGERLAVDAATRLGLAIDPDGQRGLIHRPDKGAYIYRFTSSRDFTEAGGRSMILFDSDTGRLLKTVLPQGRNSANSFTNWIMALHMGFVFGLPYRIFVSLMGGMVTMLSVTGIVIWMRKRSGRLARAARIPDRFQTAT